MLPPVDLPVRAVLPELEAALPPTGAGVRTVVDAGLTRVPRTDLSRGLSALVTVPVSRASAQQRAGRAGREAPGGFNGAGRRPTTSGCPRTPSTARIRVDYSDPEAPTLLVRVQEVFGCRATPVVAGRPLRLHLLSPARRVVAVTSDLVSSWLNGYPEVRSDLRGRYPRHAWPLDPGATPFG